MTQSDWETIKAILAGAAVIVSVASFVVAQRALSANKRPVLVFVYDTARGWLLRNVGNGPALNLVIAQKQPGGSWFAPVRVPPLSKDGELVLSWLDHVNTTGLGAAYSNFEGVRYTSVCGDDLTKVHNKDRFPKWPEREIERHWTVHPSVAVSAAPEPGAGGEARHPVDDRGHR